MRDEKLTLYLDTSIPSAYYDTSKPVRQLITQKWFEQKASGYCVYTSVTTIDEIDEFGNLTKRQQIKDLLLDHQPTILDVTPEVITLAQQYMDNGAIPRSEPEDAYHIAIASVNRLDGLASWNFKHIVSMNPIRKIHKINLKHGCSILEIGSLELFGGAEYGNL